MHTVSFATFLWVCNTIGRNVRFGVLGLLSAYYWVVKAFKRLRLFIGYVTITTGHITLAFILMTIAWRGCSKGGSCQLGDMVAHTFSCFTIFLMFVAMWWSTALHSQMVRGIGSSTTSNDSVDAWGLDGS